jgi:DNA invertase Pin-like site-specific DNA recombinase
MGTRHVRKSTSGIPSRTRYLYERVSGRQQRHDRQDHALQQWLLQQPEGVKVVRETHTGYISQPPMLQRILDEIRQGGVESLTVYDIDRLGRNTTELHLIRDLCKKNSSKLWIERLGLDLTGEAGLIVFSVMSALAETESDKISARTKEGVDAWKKQGGVSYGTRLKGTTYLSKKHYAKVDGVKALASQGFSVAYISRQFGIRWDRTKWIIDTPRHEIKTRQSLARELKN